MGVGTREEVKVVLQQVSGPTWLMMRLFHGPGLRLMECLRLRVKDVDFTYQHITVGAFAPQYRKAQGAVKLSEGITPPAGLQNRACHFRGTRLLS